MPPPTVPDLTTLDCTAVERFRADVERVLGRTFAAEERLALAVSGGPDSMAMLALAAAAFPGQVIAATVDHRLRLAAASEASMVAGWCRRAGIAHETLVVADEIGTSAVQARARDRRYALLLRWADEAGARFLATAHHADDQAETFLMRAARGSGVAGLAGVRARQRQVGTPSIEIIRPLLKWRVSELRAVALQADLPFVDDPSNVDEQYERTRVRTLLRSAPWLDPAKIAYSAEHAADADATLRGIERWLWDTRKVAPAGIDDPASQRWLDMGDLPREVKRRLARSAIHAVRAVNGITRPAFDDSTNVEALLDALDGGKAATQAGIMASAKGLVWRFAAQPPRRSP